MPRRKTASSDELKAALANREHYRRLSHHETYIGLLRLAARSRSLSKESTEDIERLIRTAENERQSLVTQITGRIEPRRRPKRPKSDPRPVCPVFLDECGSHSLTTTQGFGAFVLSAVIIAPEQFDAIDKEWKQWKVQELGRDASTHEPDVRGGKGPFWFNGDRKRRASARESLARKLTELDFTGIACVVVRDKYEDVYGKDAMDASLPDHIYLMALDFLAERIVLALDREFGGAIGRVYAESRGPREDATLQYEFVRLQLDGTSYISDSWFRYQLIPGIEFRSKEDNLTGLQLADLLARPCGEKVMDPTSTPDRWPELREKLCQSNETEHSILGLKIVPWDEACDGLWKS